jgi:hypothetical protein
VSYSNEVFYSDDPVDDSSGQVKRKFSSILAFLLLLVGGTYLVQTTLAANISLNTGSPIEFGQGITATAACSGATNLTITPNSTFTNVSAGGAYYLSSITVSNIPANCEGKDFTINAYGNSDSTPLELFNTTSKNAVVYDNAGTFELGTGSLTGASIASGSGTFTVTFTNPVATSGSVFKITLQSGSHTASPCLTGGPCSVGEDGPGGGKVFYVSASPFACGPYLAASCSYLEVAPSAWVWSGGTGDFTASWLGGSYGPIAQDLGIGNGAQNTRLMVARESTLLKAGTATNAYRGAGLSDWYLPSKDELNELCKFARGQDTGNAGIQCDNSGTLKAGFQVGTYWSSTTNGTGGGISWAQIFGTGGSNAGYRQGYWQSDTVHYIRPVRAF